MTETERCPQILRESLYAYVAYGQLTDGFLRAVLENDLKGAAMRADPENARLLADIVGFVNAHVPIQMRGSANKVSAHLARERKTK